MKKLSLLVFAILVLGCGTETPMVEESAPVIEGPAPVVVSGEHLRLSIVEPDIMFGTVRNGEDNVDPEPINVVGLRFDFDQDLKLYRADLRIKDGESLDWLPQGVVDQGNIGNVVLIEPRVGLRLLELGTEYEINIFAQDLGCNTSEHVIRFWTKPKP